MQLCVQLAGRLFKKHSERFHDEATPGDRGGHYGDVNHIGTGAAEHIDNYTEDLAEHDEDHGDNDGSLGFQVEEDLKHPTGNQKGSRGKCDIARAA